jgi:ketosteroid isomerase-like protein
VRIFLGTFAVVTLCVACSAPAPQFLSNTAANDAAAHQAHEAYVTAINSNNLDSLLCMLTDDVVFLSAHEPVMVGKAAVTPWLKGYLQGVQDALG